jgi:hypothetical protein
MAPRKTRSTAAPSKAKAPAAAPQRRATREYPQTSDTGNSNRLLREAAWSRMFGRVESKNPFTR